MLRTGLVLGTLLFATCSAAAAEEFKNQVVPGAELGEFRHGTYPSIGKRTHVGIDLVAPCGTPVYALSGGDVIDVIADPNDRDFNSLGYMVMLQQGKGVAPKPYATLYLHLQDPPELRIGDRVGQGGKVGKIGDTGFSLGCHLHFEARHFLTRFHPDWNNIYGDGDQRNTDAFRNDWADAEALLGASRAEVAEATSPVANCAADFVTIEPGSASCGFSLSESGHVTFDQSHEIELPKFGNRTVIPGRLIHFPSSPTGRYRVVRVCDKILDECWFQFAFDTQDRRAAWVEAGRYGPIDWINWTEDEKTAALLSSGEGVQVLHFLSTEDFTTQHIPEYGTHRFNAYIDHSSFSWTSNSAAQFMAAWCLPPRYCDGVELERDGKLAKLFISSTTANFITKDAAETNPPPVHFCDVRAADPHDPNRVTDPDTSLQKSYIIYRKLSEKACKEAVSRFPGVARFQYQYARALSEVKFHESKPIMRKAAARDYPPAHFWVGHHTFTKYNETGDKALALESMEHYRKSAELGYAPAFARLAGFYHWGVAGIPKDREKAIELYTKGAKKGDAPAMGELAFLYYGEESGKGDYQAAERWFKKLADGEFVSEYIVSSNQRYIQTGQNGLKNAQDMIQRLQVAEAKERADAEREAEKQIKTEQFGGNAQRCDELAAHPLDPNKVGAGVDGKRLNARQAIPVCQKAAQEHPEILRFQYQYARALQVASKWADAVRILQRLAERNYSAAHMDLGLLYLRETLRFEMSVPTSVVPLNPEKGVKHLTLAAGHNHVHAQANLGYLYEQGRHVSRDLKEAQKWYQRAADGGYSWAKDALRRVTAEFKKQEAQARVAANQQVQKNQTQSAEQQTQPLRTSTVTDLNNQRDAILSSPSGRWVEDRDTGCKLFTVADKTTSFIKWDGECPNGFVNGDGHLEWFDRRGWKSWDTIVKKEQGISATDGVLVANIDLSKVILKYQQPCGAFDGSNKYIYLYIDNNLRFSDKTVVYYLSNAAFDIAAKTCDDFLRKRIGVSVAILHKKYLNWEKGFQSIYYVKDKGASVGYHVDKNGKRTTNHYVNYFDSILKKQLSEENRVIADQRQAEIKKKKEVELAKKQVEDEEWQEKCPGKWNNFHWFQVDDTSVENAEFILSRNVFCQSRDRIKFLSFRKINAQKAELFGVPIYRLFYSAELKFPELVYWRRPGRSFLALKEKPSYAHLEPSLGTVEAGTVFTISGEMHFEKMEKGWKGHLGAYNFKQQ